MKNFISASQISRTELDDIFNLTDKIKKNKKKYSNLLKGYVISTLFFEPSTRTRLSFESAILRLGAGLISTENARENASAKKGESLEDTIRIVQGYSDMIVMRHFDNDAAERAVKVAKVPIINAGSGGGEHPTQALLDLYTIRQYKGKIDNIKIAILGDLKYGRTAHSLIKLLCLYNNITVYGFPVHGLELQENYKNFLKNNNVTYIECKSLNEIPYDVDFIYQTRVQKERLEDKNLEIEDIILNKENFKRFSEKTFLMHPLPRVNEISTDLDDDNRSIFFEQAHNGLYTRMALILTLMKDFYNNKWRKNERAY